MSCNPFLAGAGAKVTVQQLRISDCESRIEFEEEFETAN